MHKSDKQFPNPLLLWGTLLLSGICALIFYNKLDNPFGGLFWGSMYGAIGGILLFLMLLSAKAIHSSRKALRYLGFGGALLALLAGAAVISLANDYRQLLFPDSIAGEISEEDWQEDLAFLAREMPARHRDLFRAIPQDSFRLAVENLQAAIPTLNDFQIITGFMRIVAMPNDGHTWLQPFQPAINANIYPLQFFWFDDGIFVINAADAYREIIGTRLLKIADHNILEIFEKMKPLIGAENDLHKKYRFQMISLTAEILHGLGITATKDEASFTVEKSDGSNFTLSMTPAPFYTWLGWSALKPVENLSAPAISNSRKDWYWFELNPASKHLYVQFNQVLNQSGRETLDDFVERLSVFVDENSFDRFILDIRNNHGGNNQMLGNFIELLSTHPKINRRGAFFVLTGRRTFSAAVNFTAMLETRTKALFVGEPTGQGPNLFGDNRPIYLPNSRIRVDISSRWWEGSIPEDNREWFYPDIPVVYTHEDYLNGRDPALNTATSYQPDEKLLASLPKDFKQLALAGEKLPTRPLPLDQAEADAITGKYLFSSMGILSITQRDSQLFLTIDDPLEGNIFSVLSELHPIGNMAFTTDINEVGISFANVSGAAAPQLHLFWGDSQRILEKLPAGYMSPLEMLRAGKITDGIAAIRADKANFASGYSNLERLLNDLGYQHLQQGQHENAIAIFQLNTELFPESWNVYDSLAESFMTSGNNTRAKEYYQKALTLNPNSDHSRRMLDQLR